MSGFCNLIKVLAWAEIKTRQSGLEDILYRSFSKQLWKFYLVELTSIHDVGR